TQYQRPAIGEPGLILEVDLGVAGVLGVAVGAGTGRASEVEEACIGGVAATVGESGDERIAMSAEDTRRLPAQIHAVVPGVLTEHLEDRMVERLVRVVRGQGEAVSVARLPGEFAGNAVEPEVALLVQRHAA